MFFHGHRCDDVQSLAPRRLTKAYKPERFQTLLHFFRGFDNCVERDVWRGVEIENQPARNGWMVRLVIPWVIFDRSNLGRCNQPFDGVELNIGLSVSTYFNQIDVLRHTRHRVPLEKPFTLDPIRSSDDRAWPSFEMLDHPRANLFQVVRQLDL